MTIPETMEQLISQRQLLVDAKRAMTTLVQEMGRIRSLQRNKKLPVGKLLDKMKKQYSVHNTYVKNNKNFLQPTKQRFGYHMIDDNGDNHISPIYANLRDVCTHRNRIKKALVHSGLLSEESPQAQQMLFRAINHRGAKDK